MQHMAKRRILSLLLAVCLLLSFQALPAAAAGTGEAAPVPLGASAAVQAATANTPAPRLKELSIRAGDTVYSLIEGGTPVPAGGDQYTLLPIPSEDPFHIEIEEDVFLSTLLDATLEYSFVDGAEGVLVDRWGRTILPGDTLFDNPDNGFQVLVRGLGNNLTLYAGPPEQLNPDRVEYRIFFDGGIDDLSGFHNACHVISVGYAGHSSGLALFRVPQDSHLLEIPFPPHDLDTEYWIAYDCERVSPTVASGLISVHEGQGTDGADITEQMTSWEGYSTSHIDGKWFTFTFWYLGEPLTRSFQVRIVEDDGIRRGSLGIAFDIDYEYLGIGLYDADLLEGLTDYPYAERDYLLALDPGLDLTGVVPQIQFSGGGLFLEDVVIKADGRVIQPGVTPVDFSGGSVEFTAEANGKTVGQRACEFVKVRPGEGFLYIPAKDVQQVEYTNLYPFAEWTVANIGTEAIHDIGASLASGAVVELNPYWTIGGSPTNSTLRGVDLSKAGEWTATEWSMADVEVKVKPGTRAGSYSDQLRFTVGGQVVRTLQLNIVVEEDIRGGSTDPGDGDGDGDGGGTTPPGGGDGNGDGDGGTTNPGDGNGGDNGTGGGGLTTSPGGGGSSGGSSRGGGGGGSSRTDTSSRAGSAVSSTSTIPQWMDASQASGLLATAGQEGVALRRTSPFGMRLSGLRALGSTPLQVDTVSGSAVALRVRVPHPGQATTDLLLTGAVDGARVDATKALFAKWFGNRTAVISLDQQGSFGQPVQLAAKVDLSGMDTQNLAFYAYDRTANAYQRIPAPNYRIDTAGYLHFTTGQAGDIIVSSGALAAK